jgi:hypothetical protein
MNEAWRRSNEMPRPRHVMMLWIRLSSERVPKIHRGVYLLTMTRNARWRAPSCPTWRESSHLGPARQRDLCLITLASLQTGVNTHLTLSPSPSERDLCWRAIERPQNNSASSSEVNLKNDDNTRASHLVIQRYARRIGLTR